MHDGMYCWFRDHGWYTTFSSALWDKTIRVYSEEMFTQNSDITTKRCIHYKVRSEWFQIQPLYLSVWCHVLVLNVPCKPLMFAQVKYFVNLTYFCFGWVFLATYCYICSNLRFLVVEQISLVCLTLCSLPLGSSVYPNRTKMPVSSISNGHAKHSISHVRSCPSALVQEAELECEDKWCSDSENFINPSRGNFLLDHSTIQWHEGIR